MSARRHPSPIDHVASCRLLALLNLRNYLKPFLNHQYYKHYYGTPLKAIQYDIKPPLIIQYEFLVQNVTKLWSTIIKDIKFDVSVNYKSHSNCAPLK